MRAPRSLDGHGTGRRTPVCCQTCAAARLVEIKQEVEAADKVHAPVCRLRSRWQTQARKAAAETMRAAELLYRSQALDTPWPREGVALVASRGLHILQPLSAAAAAGGGLPWMYQAEVGLGRAAVMACPLMTVIPSLDAGFDVRPPPQGLLADPLRRSAHPLRYARHARCERDRRWQLLAWQQLVEAARVHQPPTRGSPCPTHAHTSC